MEGDPTRVGAVGPAGGTAQDDPVSVAVDRLYRAARSRTPCAPVRELLGPDDVERAYVVQQRLLARRVADGARVVGRKIGLTSAAVQQQLGVDRPDFGVLLDDMDLTGIEPIPAELLLQPRIEAEVAFVLGADLDDGPMDPVQVRSAVAYAVAALEIVDSRIAGWDIGIVDTVADNASSGLFVLGREHRSLEDVEPADVRMTMRRDGTVMSTGTGAACLGDPLNALAWLARTASDLGDPLRAGHVVLSGALGPMVETPPGCVVETDLGPLGRLEVSFAPTGHPSSPSFPVPAERRFA